ncbi:glyoxylate reductase/hydroxypyruvate reductase [Achlya hypogyna]|uniref:Glyoxylate reductase/hydroxypyruvate reductase n=1 Tax=Achlya hypogyna TaxID=1202772 RepID=A0A1V9Z177_ACHHY|nr:glyoxylate reductase/hydroxypyruvate reductase [Achlya hypogyna]
METPPWKLLVTRHIPYVLEQLAKNPTIRVDCYEAPDTPMPPDELTARAVGCDGVLIMHTDKITGSVLDAMGPTVQVISTISAGYDHVDVPACRARGVAVGNTSGCLHVSTAELAVSLTFAAKRRLAESHKCAAAGDWGKPLPEDVAHVYCHPRFCGSDVSNCTVGVVGLGEIGLTYARMMHFGFQCRILYTGRHEKTDLGGLPATFVDLPTLLAESDIVSLHCPLSEATRHLIDAGALRCMKRTAVLINTARGGIVDQDALAAALAAKTIAGAGLDVTTPEPLPSSHALFQAPNCLIVPHIGSATTRTRQAMCDRAIANAVAGMAGRPLPSPVL